MSDDFVYCKNLHSEINTIVSEYPTARVHRVEWAKIIAGDPVEINPSIGEGFKVNLFQKVWDSLFCRSWRWRNGPIVGKSMKTFLDVFIVEEPTLVSIISCKLGVAGRSNGRVKYAHFTYSSHWSFHSDYLSWLSSLYLEIVYRSGFQNSTRIRKRKMDWRNQCRTSYSVNSFLYLTFYRVYWIRLDVKKYCSSCHINFDTSHHPRWQLLYKNVQFHLNRMRLALRRFERTAFRRFVNSIATANRNCSRVYSKGRGNRRMSSHSSPSRSLVRRLREPLVWIDLEMTGLDLKKDTIIEIACILTDGSMSREVEVSKLFL